MNNVKQSKRLRAFLFAGTACLTVLGLGATATVVPFSMSQPAYAQAPSSFAPIVEKVRPAVVSVQVKGERRRASRSLKPRPRERGFGFNIPSPGGDFFHFDFSLPFFSERGPKDRFDDDMRDYFSRRFGNRPDDRQEDRIPGDEVVSIGSGFVISKDGYIVTNNHVIENGKSFSVSFNDDKDYTATLVGADPKSDLAVLKIETDDSLPYVSFAEAPSRIGDWVLVVGNPFGLGGTVTAGIVSADGRSLGASLYEDFIQIDAPINKGNSGGPAFNTEGEVIGVSTAIISPGGGSVGIGMAIPASAAKAIVGALIDKGEVDRGWLGVKIQSINEDLAEALKLPEAKGALINEMSPGTPALKSGLKVGDVIVSVDGRTVENSKDLARKIGFTSSGKTVTLGVYRNGEELDIDVTLGKQTPQAEQALLSGERSDDLEEDTPATTKSRLEDYGLRFDTPDAREGREGLVISAVKPRSLAEESTLKPGDVIISANYQTLESEGQLIQAIEAAKNKGEKAILTQISRNDTMFFIALKVTS